MAAVLGFLTLIGLDVALGMRSTARFEFDRNGVQEKQRPMAVSAAGARRGMDSAAVPAAAPVPVADAVPSGGAAGEPLPARLTAHPAGTRMGRPSPPAWWLVEEEDDDGPGRVLAGPFGDRLEADLATLSGGLPDGTAQVVYGVCREGGSLVRRPSPEELAWLAALGEQLDRLPDDWDTLLTDTDPLTTLAVELTAALLEAGLGLHDCSGRGPAPASGGVCLTPYLPAAGILVSWHQHDRMARDQVRGAAGTAVQELMNVTVAAVLDRLGFAVEPFGTGCSLVRLTEA